jgi:hypothetical protein
MRIETTVVTSMMLALLLLCALEDAESVGSLDCLPKPTTSNQPQKYHSTLFLVGGGIYLLIIILLINIVNKDDVHILSFRQFYFNFLAGDDVL